MPKKILIIGPDFYHYNHSVEQSFQRLGFETKLYAYFTDKNSPMTRASHRIAALLKSDRVRLAEVKDINEKARAIFQGFKPDIVLVIKGEVLSEATLSQFSGSFLIYWMQDSVFRFPACIDLLKFYDKVFMFERTDVDKLDALGVKSFFLPMAFDETINFPMENERDIDLLFIGTLKGDRTRTLQKLIADFPGLNIKIYGDYLPLFDLARRYRYYSSGEYTRFTNKTLTAQEANLIYSRTKIALNMHISQSSYGCNPRVFEILGSRTFQLVDKNAYLEDELDGMLACYASYDDLVLKIRHYLAHDSEREQISRLGYEKVSKKHRFIDRITEMIEISGI